MQGETTCNTCGNEKTSKQICCTYANYPDGTWEDGTCVDCCSCNVRLRKYDSLAEKDQHWQDCNLLSVRYHLEQIAMQVGSCEGQIAEGKLNPGTLEGYIGELRWQLRGLEDLLSITEESNDIDREDDLSLHGG